MLQLIHQYKKTIFGFLFLTLAAISLAGMGLDTLRMSGRSARSGGPSAITVNGEETSFSELARARQQGAIPAQQAVDGLIDQALLRQLASSFGYVAGPQTVRALVAELFPGGIDPSAAQEMLRKLGISVADFDKLVLHDALSRQLVDTLAAAVRPTDQEIRASFNRKEANWTVSVASLKPEAVLSAVEKPTEEQIQTYYSERGSDFEVPPAVQYDYVLFTPERYAASVEVTPEDIELYYADNQSDFSIPESAHVAHIQLTYDKKSSDPAAMAAVKQRAEQALTRAKAGEDFNSLVLEYSNDVLTSVRGGDMGFIQRGVGKRDPAFDSAVFKLKAPGIADLVETDYGFHVVKVLEYKPTAVKPLADVKSEIISLIQKREAPSYASARAQTLYDEWKKSGQKLSEFAAARGLVTGSTKSLLTKSEDPETDAHGLTAAVLGATGQTQQLVELDNESALVEVKGSREADIAPLSAVHDKIVSALQMKAAQNLIQARATTLAGTERAQFQTEAKKLGFTVEKLSNISEVKPLPASINSADIRKTLFSLSTTGPASHPTTVGGAVKVLLVEEHALPSDKQYSESKDKEQLRRMTQYRLVNVLQKSLVAGAKQTAKVEVNPQALAD